MSKELVEIEQDCESIILGPNDCFVLCARVLTVGSSKQGLSADSIRPLVSRVTCASSASWCLPGRGKIMAHFYRSHPTYCPVLPLAC